MFVCRSSLVRVSLSPASSLPLPSPSVSRSAPWEKPLRGGGRSHTAAVTWPLKPPPPLRATTTTISEAAIAKDEEMRRTTEGGRREGGDDEERKRDDPPSRISSQAPRSITPTQLYRWPQPGIGRGRGWLLGIYYAGGDALFSLPMLEIRLCRSFVLPLFLSHRASEVGVAATKRAGPGAAAPVGRVVPIVGVCFARPRPRVSLSIVREWALPNYEFPTQNRGDKKRVGRRRDGRRKTWGSGPTCGNTKQLAASVPCSTLGKNVGWPPAGPAKPLRREVDRGDRRERKIPQIICLPAARRDATATRFHK